jgi:hypothetical protein
MGLLHHLLAQLLLLVACSSAFPLTLPFSIEPAISKAPPFSPLEKRVDVHTTGDASQKEIEDLKAELDFCIKLARTVVDNVHRNHALYLRFYGSPEYFDEVMAVHRRIADLGNNNQLIRFSFRDEAQETGHGQAAASYGFSENFPTITLYRGYRGQNPNDLSRNVEFVAMQHSAPNLLDRASTTRAGILYHEVCCLEISSSICNSSRRWVPGHDDANRTGSLHTGLVIQLNSDGLYLTYQI